MNRVICNFTQGFPGPLFICLAGIHGNEHAGLSALRRIEHLLKDETIKNPSFKFSGTFTGLAGNLQAIDKKIRFIEMDLNRIFREEIISEVFQMHDSSLKNEKLELKELMQCINQIIKENHLHRVVLLDLHTTSATGGLFAIPSEDSASIDIAKALHAPVIKGFMGGLAGTTLHYFSLKDTSEGKKITPLVFEAGQHDDPFSVNRIIAAVINCMRTIGCVDSKDVENHHDEILQSYSVGLPAVTRLVYRYKISGGENFKMLPGFENFQRIKKGQVLATSNQGRIESECDGYILMPLYQNIGEDGFFIVVEDN